jgi:uncharacterized membrane protein YtjA (UPF0391 family)
MLRLALLFLVLGIFAGILGFTGIAGASFAIAKFLFFVFLVIFLILLITGLTIARKVTGGRTRDRLGASGGPSAISHTRQYNLK